MHTHNLAAGGKEAGLSFGETLGPEVCQIGLAFEVF